MPIPGRIIMNNMEMQKKSGFTFIEMMLVTAMVGVIAIALYGMISNGLKVWEVVNQETPQLNSTVLFEKMTMDLENGVFFKDIAFIGDENSCSFSCISRTAKAENGFFNGVGKVRYFYDNSNKSFKRQYVDYNQFSALKQPDGRILIGNISKILLNYYFFDEQKKVFLWSNVWPPESYESENKKSWPLALRANIVFEIEERILQKVKTFNIPIGAIEF